MFSLAATFGLRHSSFLVHCYQLFVRSLIIIIVQLFAPLILGFLSSDLRNFQFIFTDWTECSLENIVNLVTRLQRTSSDFVHLSLLITATLRPAFFISPMSIFSEFLGWHCPFSLLTRSSLVCIALQVSMFTSLRVYYIPSFTGFLVCSPTSRR